MFGLSFGEILVIAILALVLVGPTKLPDLARQAGRMFVQFRRMTSDVRNTVENVIRKAEEEIRREEQDAYRKILESVNPNPAPHHAQPVMTIETVDTTASAHHERPAHHLDNGHNHEPPSQSEPPIEGKT